ncbi:MAG: PAS domain S-box protein [Candidatus Aminicenantes bacterium]|nr:PAS domain S-box protein [Candidatus Aminicenantes bacterium]
MKEDNDITINREELINKIKKLQLQLSKFKSVDAEYRKAEEALLASEQNLSQFLDAIPYGVFIIDHKGNPQFANQAAREILGQDIFKETSYEKMKESHRAYFSGTRLEYPLKKMPIFRALKGDRSTIDDIEVHFDDKVIPLEISATPVYGMDGSITNAIAIFQDISKRKQARKAMKESEEKYRRLIDNSLVGIYIAQKHIIKFCNQRFAGIFGYESLAELIERPIKDIIAPESWKLVDKEVRLRESGIKETSSFEFKGLSKEGETFDIEALGNRILYQGSPAVQGILLNITERKQAESERQRLEDQLHQVQKMEAIGTLAGGIAHDFNNILSAIIGYTELAVSDIPENIETRQKLSQVLAAADRARAMVKQILAFSRKGEKEQRPIMLDEIVNEAFILLRSSLPTTIEIRPNFGDKLNPVMANPTQIHQVIMNICTNAAHAMKEEGGILEIALKEIDLVPGSIEIKNLEPGVYQQLTISDTGHGMSLEIKSRIFEPYFTTKPKGEGTGMGLAVVHGIVKNHSGEIKVYSEPGKGTTFHVFLPVTRAETMVGFEQIEPIQGGEERILYVDDENNLAEMGKQMLESIGYRIESRTSSIEALEAFRSGPGKFSLVITDQTMPNMTGLQLAKEIRKISPHIPVILCTGFSESVNEENFKSMGISAFVMKPIVRKEIARVIREVLDETGRLREES